MQESKYLVVGSSHAALQAIIAIRKRDVDGSLTVLTREPRLPYSPTILPYIVSSQKQPDDISLCDEAHFARNNVTLVRGTTVTAVQPDTKIVRTGSGDEWRYDRLLLATGASPATPPIPGLREVPFHVLRTMNDAIELRDALRHAASAVVIGGGLCAMHAVESMAKAGITVTVVEICDRILRECASPRAGEMIARSFMAEGIEIRTNRSPVAVAREAGKYVVTLNDGATIVADLLMVAAGVKPVTDYLVGSGVKVNRGIVVDELMRTSEPGIWAAGDVAETPGFWGGGVVNGILPGAAAQGRTAGANMADGNGTERYAGAIPLNTYHFFGHHLISVGINQPPSEVAGFEIHEDADDDGYIYRQIMLQEGRLVGISTIDDVFDAGIMKHIILGRIDLSPVKAAFLARPREAGRLLMSQMWR
ncbi:MAG: NAD(P)/FAD-dependent oxidoreductase [Rhodoplanes sp.]|uniref:NADH-dependent phenylglyoxylate dehydrogenase subunit epsilon n=1 Tax=Rhodoplanes sp. TaxID=1968906 RepID=UPI0017ACFD66|nr:FAD-dependent oxidoreductase [Rhodoplanes sp.]NVO15264.1 NAD(P)/FAD-dependent oxidoreductase [Rhodoplanes sp.]